MQVISNEKMIKIPYLKYWKDFIYVEFPVIDILKELITKFESYIFNNFKYSKRYPILEINNTCLSYVNELEYQFNHILMYTNSLSLLRQNYYKLNIDKKIREYQNLIVNTNKNLLKKELKDLVNYKENKELNKC